MHKKFVSILAVVAVLGALLAIAGPASATHTTTEDVASFMPNGEDNDKDALSDAHDGTDETAHLTAVADPAADRVSWYYCPQGSDPGDSGCALIGTDSSGTQPAPPGSDPDDETQSAEAYEFDWNIPAILDNEYVDIFVLACTGAPNNPGDPEVSTNCEFSEESNIFLDSGDTSAGGGAFDPTQDIPTGEIVGMCEGGNGSSTPTECDVQGEFGENGHGSTLPNGDFALLFTTSEDVTIGNVWACLDDLGNDDTLPTDPDISPDPEACDYLADNVTQVPQNNALDRDPGNTFIAWWSAGNIPDGGDVDVAIYGQGDDQPGECTGQNFSQHFNACVFDEHYKTIPERENAAINASFGDLPGTVAEEGCDQTDNEVDRDNYDNVVTGEPNNNEDVNTYEEVEGCLFNQFGNLDDTFIDDPTNPATAGATFVLEGPGHLNSFGFCTDQDTDSDGDNDVAADCASGWDEGGEFSVRLEPSFDANNNVERGDSAVTFCVDQEASNNTSTEFGCADEAQSSSVNKEFIGQASDVALVFAPADGSAPPADPCAAGDQFRTNLKGDTDTLIVCTYDPAGNLVTTNTTDQTVASGRLTWTNTAPGTVSFLSNPPVHTGDDGTAELDILAANTGSATITVTLCYDVDEDGDRQCTTAGNDDENTESASVTKTVQENPQDEPDCNDGVDNDGDGKIDFGNDPGCASADDNTEDSEGTEPTITRHNRIAKIAGFKHVDVGKKNPALRVKAKVTHDDGHNVPGCQNDVPVDFQIKAGGEWITRKSSNTNDNGVAKILIRDLKAKYRAIAVRHELADETANTVDICRKDVSPARRHRH